jgi:hypothetical protein
MSLRVSTRAKRLGRTVLPAELRLMILEQVAQQKQPG